MHIYICIYAVLYTFKYPPVESKVVEQTFLLIRQEDIFMFVYMIAHNTSLCQNAQNTSVEFKFSGPSFKVSPLPVFGVG